MQNLAQYIFTIAAGISSCLYNLDKVANHFEKIVNDVKTLCFTTDSSCVLLQGLQFHCARLRTEIFFTRTNTFEHAESRSEKFLSVETGSQGLFILSYATVCLQPSVSLNNAKNVVKLVKIKYQFVKKLRVYGVETLRLRIWIVLESVNF